jgi:hypothetical protein
MPSLIERIKQFRHSPQGQRAMDTARRAASDPKKKAQARRLLSRLRGRR